MSPLASPLGQPRQWAELGEREPSPERTKILLQALADAGVQTESRFVRCDRDSFESALEEAKAAQIGFFRLSGDLTEVAIRRFSNLPSQLLSLKAADALVTERDGRLWPRNFLSEAIQRLIAADLRDLDLSGGAFINGATPEARAFVGALVRAGFRRVNLTDTDARVGEMMIEDFRRCYFNVQFQFTLRQHVTQLAGTHTIAVNTVEGDTDPSKLGEFFYFNFLKSGGVWMELPSGPRSDELIQEARSVGANAIPGSRIAAFHDVAWAESCFGVKLDPRALGDAFASSERS